MSCVYCHSLWISLIQGFFEWIYGLILEIWNYFSSALLDVMSLDFAYLKSHIPVMGDIQQIILAAGWALLLGNLVFQALRSMASGLGIEGEDTKLLFARTFVFGFLLLASPQICETVLGMTSKVIALLEVPDAIHVQLVDSSVIGVFTAAWLLVIMCAAGHGPSQIARKLSEEQVLCPTTLPIRGADKTGRGNPSEGKCPPEAAGYGFQHRGFHRQGQTLHRHYGADAGTVATVYPEDRGA